MYAVKGEGVPAPEDASPGRHGQAYGTIDWLQLEAKEGDVTAQTVGYEQAYRVVTAGGKPPPSCNGFGDHIEVPYIAEYWYVLLAFVFNDVIDS